MHVALVCPDMLGHLNPMTALGRAVADRGHRVSLACSPEFRTKAEAAGLGFIPVGQKEFDDGIHAHISTTRVSKRSIFNFGENARRFNFIFRMFDV